MYTDTDKYTYVSVYTYFCTCALILNALILTFQFIIRYACIFTHLQIYIYIYIYIYRILSPVKPELGVIPSGQENIREYLDLPGKGLNVSIIQSNIFIKKKQRNQSQRIINLFQSCYAFLKFSKTRKKINRTSSDQLDKKTRVDT